MKENDELILSALISCGSIRKASEKIGISEYTIRNRLKNSTFKTRYEKLKNSLITEACAELISKLSDAISVLHEVAMDDTTAESVRVSASDSLLRHGIRYIEACNILTRLDAIERKMNNYV